MSKRKYTRDDYEAYFVMLGIVGNRWELAVGHPGYRNSTGWNLLTRLWRQGPIKMSAAYEFIPEVKSPSKRRELIERAIADKLIDCSDTKLAEQLRTGRIPNPRRGKTSPDIWLSAELGERLEAFLEDVVDELLKTASWIKARTRAGR